MSIPELTDDQRQAARAAASAARRARADFKARVARGDLTLAEALALAATDEALANCQVVALLRSLPRVGEKRAQEAMERHQIAANRRIRGLGHRQIAGLLEDFR